MRINCSKYQNALLKVERLMDNRKNPEEWVSTISSVTHIPLIAVCLYMLKYKYPDSSSLKGLIKGYVDFYGYTEIIDFDGNVIKV